MDIGYYIKLQFNEYDNIYTKRKIKLIWYHIVIIKS